MPGTRPALPREDPPANISPRRRIPPRTVQHHEEDVEPVEPDPLGAELLGPELDRGEQAAQIERAGLHCPRRQPAVDERQPRAPPPPLLDGTGDFPAEGRGVGHDLLETFLKSDENAGLVA